MSSNIWPGSDPKLRNEVILVSAHYDHVGTSGEDIYNGADDDGSGTVTVVEIARAFASLETPPRRSIIFMTVSGEEKGLLGSRYYAENPTFPLESTVASINLEILTLVWMAVTCARAFLMEVNLAQGKSKCIIYKQNYPFYRLKLVVETIEHST